MIALTKSELKAVELLSSGLSLDEISKLTNTKRTSVYCALSLVKKKLGVKSNHQLVVAFLTLNQQSKQ